MKEDNLEHVAKMIAGKCTVEEFKTEYIEKRILEEYLQKLNSKQISFIWTGEAFDSWLEGKPYTKENCYQCRKFLQDLIDNSSNIHYRGPNVKAKKHRV